MKINNIVYFTDEYILLKNKKIKEIIKCRLNKNIINNGKIVNAQKFIKAFELLLKKYHLNTSLFGDTLKIIVNSYYNLLDKQVLKNIFSTFNYRKIVIENATKILKLNSINAYLEIYDSYQVLTYLDEYKKVNCTLIPSNFFVENSDLLKYIKYKIQDKELYLFGNGDTLNYFFEEFEDKYNTKTYVFSNYKDYLISNAKVK